MEVNSLADLEFFFLKHRIPYGRCRREGPLATATNSEFRSRVCHCIGGEQKERQEGRSRGPRSLFLRRCDNNGFGFTLRHFIVYPPESYSVSDRIISVNGENITGRTYAQVVQLIQQSGNFLHLLVVPKEDDILQLYFGETAHNPETNQRPSRVKSPEVSVQHHCSSSMMRQQSPVPFPTSQHHHHRQHLAASQNQAKPRSNSSSYLPPDTAPFQQPSRSALPPHLWATASGNGNAERMNLYHGAGAQDSGADLSNYRSHIKSPSSRRNSEGNGPPSSNRDSAYGYGGRGATGSGNESNLYYNVPGNERRVSSDNAVWGRGPSSGTMYKLRQSEDVVGSAGGGMTYPEGTRTMLSSLGPLSDSLTSSSYGSSENVHSSAGSANSLQRLHYSGTAGCRLSLDAGTTRRDSSVSLPSNGFVRENYTASDGSKDSLVSYDSNSTLTGGQDRCSSDDSLIMSRIRKSFEQKEEFLKRPNQPISWNVNSGNQPQSAPSLSSQHAIIAREFYARPQKFQRPVWPPTAPSSSPILYRQQSPPRSSSSGKSNYSSSSSSVSNKPTHQNLQRVKSDIDSERDSLSSRSSGEEKSCHERASSEPWDDRRSNIRGEFIYGGPVSNVPNTVVNKSGFSQHSQFRPITPISASATSSSSSSGSSSLRHGSGGKGSFVTTLSRIHENIPVSDPGMATEPSSGNYASSNFSDGGDEVFDIGRGSSSLPPSLPSSTSSAPANIESQYSRSLSSPSEDGASKHPAHAHPMLQLVSRRAQQFETGKLDEEEGPPSDRTSFYRSELSRLSSKRSVPNVAVRKREFESRSGGGKDGRRMNRESRSLESADPPSNDDSSEPVKLRARSNSAESWAAIMGSSRQGASRNTLEWPPNRDDEGGDGANEPMRHKAVRQDSYLAAVRTPVTAGGSSGVSLHYLNSHIHGERKLSLSLQRNSPKPVSCDFRYSTTQTESRQPPGHHIDAFSPEEDRLVRRVSYLKATWGDRMHVDSDLDLSDSESPHVHRSAHRRWRPPLFPDDIQRLKRLFEEAAAPSPQASPTPGQRQRSASAAQPSIVETLRPESNKENLQLLREGWLHCKITLVDGKRAGDRSWKQVWAVLRGPVLSFYKERRDSQLQETPLNVGDSLSEQPSTGSAVDVRCSQVDIAGDYTKKKHVLRLNSLSGSELLLQAEDANDMVQWIHVLQAQAGVRDDEDCSATGSSKQQQPPQSAGASSSGGNSRLSPLPAHKGIRKLTSFRNRSPTGQSPVNKTRKPSQSDQTPSPKTKTWKGKVASKLRRIQQGAGSPSSPTAPLPEGATIGIPLEDCPQSSFSEFVPLLVELCTNIVELRGLDIIGIYRVPGNTAAVSSLTEGVNKGFDSINLQDPRWNDVNVISSLLKLFFRRLPDALLTSELYPLFIEADKIEDPGKRIITIKKLMHDLPDHHFETLKFLLFHLKKVVEHSSMNKMEARNLAIVFGPTLVRTADDNMVTMVTDMSHQCRIVESLISHDAADLEPASANHNLLLSNIQKVEGMKGDSPNKDISAKDIVSSIISAANRKMQKAKSRKGGGGSGSGPSTEEAKDSTGDVRESADVKQQTSDSKSAKRKEPGSLAENEEQQASNVASSIFESVVFSGNIVKSIHTGEEGDASQLAESANDAGAATLGDEGSLIGELLSENRSERFEDLNKDEQQSPQPSYRRDGGYPTGIEDGTIRTYAGLSATTQERIRRFERETRAMLQRDQTRQRREAEKRRIELELLQAKRDMESEDVLDAIADNPSDITKKITDMNNVLESCDRKYGTSLGHRLSSSSSLLSPPANSNTSSTKPDPPNTTSLNPEGSPQPKGNSTHKESPTTSQKFSHFTQTKKVGTTHFFPDNNKDPNKARVGAATSGSTVLTSAVVTTTTSTSMIPVRTTTDGSCNDLGGRSSWSRSSLATTTKPTSPPSSSQQEHPVNLRRGSSAENVNVQQNTNQKGAPNGTLKKLKTGKEQLELAAPVLASQPPSPLIASLRCGSLDSLQEAYGSERPQSDVSDDGSDLLASLTSTFDRKLKSLLSATTTTVEAVTDAPPEEKTTITRSSTQESSDKLPEKNNNVGTDDKLIATIVSAEVPEVASATLEKASAKPSTTTSAALFRDPSLHRRKSAAVDLHGQKQDTVKKKEEEVEKRPQEQAAVRGRSREATYLSNRRSCPYSEQKPNYSSKKCEKKTETEESSSDNLKKNTRPKSIDSASKSEKAESKLRRSESLTKSEKDEGSPANTKLKRSESLTKAEKEEATALNTKLKRSESLTKAERNSESAFASTKLKRSESLTKAEKSETSSNTRLRRSESLTKAERSESPSNSKLKRSDSLTKTEKTESNISKRRQQEMLISGTGIRTSGRGIKEKENIATILTKLKRKNGMPERSIKRRHTVGGTKDFDKLHWLDNRLQQEQLAENEAANAIAMAAMNNKERRCLRTSSPDLSSSRLSGVLAREGFLVEISLLGSGGIMAELRQHLSPVTGRPHSLPDPNLASRVFKVPLESHV
ncbi:hypothetical protein C0J52_08535 [Blattella germanica]|nr:hypothetical protein C0J52_08535 [Blattella germanica]